MEQINIGVSRGHWKELVEKGGVPCPRSGHSAVIYRSNMFVFGGHDGSTVLNDHYKLNLLTCTWENLNSVNSPPGRSSHCAVVDHLTGIIYVHGGSGNNFGSSNKKDLFGYSVRENAWEAFTSYGSEPEARYGHSMSLYNGCLYLFGGTSGYVFFNDLYLFSIETVTWIQLNIKKTPPPIRYKHSSMVLGDTLLIIGGAENKQILKDAWQINLNTIESSKIEVPEIGFIGKYTQAAELHRNDIYILGENTSQEAVSSLWRFSLKYKKWKEVIQFGSRPPSMCFYTMVLCEGYLILFGGNIRNARTNKSYVFRLSMHIPELNSPIGRLYGLCSSGGPHSDMMIIGKSGGFYTQAQIIHIRTPFLFQHIEWRGENGGFLQLDYSENSIKALLLYVYRDEVDPVLPLRDTLELFSIAAIYGIAPLLNRLCCLLSRSISVSTVKEIVNYIAEKSVNRLFHRNEFRENVEKYSLQSQLDELLKKETIDNLELSSGEQVYWVCIGILTKLNTLTGIHDTVKSDIIRAKSKNGGKEVPQKTSARHEFSNLTWCLTLLYNSEKDFFLNCQGELLAVHKFMAISNSNFFQGYFLSPGVNLHECPLDIPCEHMENIIKYMYFGPKGIQDLTPETQSMLMPYADFLQLTNTQLHDFIGNMIADILDSENVFELLLSAHRMKANVMKHMILEYFITNYKELVERNEMNSLPVEILVEMHRWRAAKDSA